jgi:regulation of enolase protein 1 (concanavalin A-like superfamily)
VVATGFDASRTAFRWSGRPRAFNATGNGIEIDAGPDTDLFADPLADGLPVLTAPRLVGHVDGDLQLQARVDVGFAATYDAGALLVWVDETNWAKLCFEQVPDGRPMIVSVVTRGRSDDANGTVVDRGNVWLRVSRLGNAFAFHASTEGSAWQLVRYFALYPVSRVAYGFLAQSPTGKGCTATFSDISLRRQRLTELRDGS